MTYYPIVGKKGPSAATALASALPTFYMGDFSVLGMRVSDCDEALRCLSQHAYATRQGAGGVEVRIDSAAAMQAVVRLLDDHGLECEVGDLADGIYQG